MFYRNPLVDTQGFFQISKDWSIINFEELTIKIKYKFSYSLQVLKSFNGLS
jgi:hypothetical protein